MRLIPSIYRYQKRWWHGGFKIFETDTTWHLIRELFWLIRHGKWCIGWNWPELIFGFSRMYYDGPNWALHAGVVSISLSSD